MKEKTLIVKELKSVRPFVDRTKVSRKRPKLDTFPTGMGIMYTYQVLRRNSPGHQKTSGTCVTDPFVNGRIDNWNFPSNPRN